MSSYDMAMKYQNYYMKDKLVYMAEMDQLSHVKNRNCYIAHLYDYTKESKKSLACIYIDVNGLHDLNNNNGHEAGDHMLQFVAGKIKDIFGLEHTYRVGGDEFVAFSIDCSEDSLKEKLSALTQAVETANYHIAVGYEYNTYSNFDIEAMVKNAEKKMYQAKRDYYIKIGKTEKDMRGNFT